MLAVNGRKYCTGHERVHPVSAFPPDSTAKDGLQNECRETQRLLIRAKAEGRPLEPRDRSAANRAYGTACAEIQARHFDEFVRLLRRARKAEGLEPRV